MIPKHLFTTWIHDDFQSPYTAAHEAMFSKCLQSWQLLMPDYRITVIRRDDLLPRSDPWLHARMAEGNFIGASQWARLQYLYEVGGIYVDMDVEAVKSFDSLLNQQTFFGIQKDNFINNAIMGSVPGHPFFEKQMAYIKTCNPQDPQFGNETGPRMVTRLLREYSDSERAQYGIAIYPSEVFYPYHWTEKFTPACIRPETLAVHHWASSWCHVL